MTPVFLIVSGRIEDTNELLQQILDYLQENIFPMLYEIRDLVGAGGGSAASPVVGDSPLMPLLVVLLFGLGFLSGVQLFRVFSSRLGGGSQ